MKIIDILYYFGYCTVTGGAIKPVEMLGTRKMNYHPYAFQLTLIILIFYTSDFITYCGFTLLIRDYQSGNIGMYSFLGMAATIAILLYWYLSNGKDAAIVAYYNDKRANSKGRDALTPLILILLAMIILGAFSRLQLLGLPLPFIKSVVKIP